ncbi:hypothetical protein BJY01DRAFT_234623 [Aspergillus pseudoustus]|uniref:N-acetyltransferase domain-containing protein n=1 Tax=Aspergillus pseudoustus TaxID=1810923 RepID=A0ABR4K219_9EURO
MTALNPPCSTCRSDKAKPKCSRCAARGLECVPVERKAVFRRGAKGIPGAGEWAVTNRSQTWVNSEPRKWRKTETGGVTAGSPAVTGDRGAGAGAGDPCGYQRIPDQVDEEEDRARSRTQDQLVHVQTPMVQISDNSEPHPIASQVVVQSPASPEYGCVSTTPFNRLDALVSAAAGLQGWSPASTTGSGGSDRASQWSHHSPHGSYTSHHQVNPLRAEEIKPLGNIEESCLLRYFIEELSPWFDHCDDRRHFGLVVPLRAQTCITVRNAIFAVSSRHLSRVPRYKAADGILYHGQLLPNLTTSSAVEYMLKCIPGLLTFQDVQDPEKQDNLMAAAIILRQYEEMEEEMEEGETDTDKALLASDAKEERHHHQHQQRVNFLAITQAIIYSMISSPLRRSSLATAAYWIAVRQEVYYALTRRRVPCITFTHEDWENATVANTMIMHAGEVTKWCWGERSVDEYERLKHQQQTLISDYSTHFIPILQGFPDKSKGEIFPTVWFATDAQVTGVQHLELARMILTAENPTLQNPSTPRSTHRKAESQVRSIVLNLCGIAVDNSPRRMPALVNAVIAIMLYGEYFTESGEREALVGVIERTKDMHAWPLQRPFERLRGHPEVLSTLVKKYKALRLHSLTTDPDAFSSTLARETAFTDDVWEKRILNPLSASLIAVPGEPGNSRDGVSSRGDHVLIFAERKEWAGQVTLLGPVALVDIAGDEGRVEVGRPWEVFDGIDFEEAAGAVPTIPPGSKVVYLLAGMYVRSEARGKGYGGLLVESGLDTVRGNCAVRGWSAVVVVMVSRGNEGARRLYERAGFVERDETISVGGHEEHVLEWKYEQADLSS